MKLISLPLSPFAARVRAAIYAKGLTVDLERPPADWMTTRSLRSLNPLARLPILVLDDGTTLAESALIIEYLEEVHRERPLLPADPVARARARFVAEVACGYVLGATMPLFESFARQEAAEKGSGDVSDRMDKVRSHLDVLESLLPVDDYACGGALTVADVAVAPVRFVLDSFTAYTRQPTLLEAYPRVADYAAVARRDPSLGRGWQEMADGLVTFMQRGSS